MNGKAYIAQAVALQAAAAIREDGHLFCDQLPSMDVEHFVVALAQQTVDPSDVSLALVGYDLSETDLRDRLNACGFPVGHVTTDLHVAAKWRNAPCDHPKIIALATGRHPGVSTLAHFRRGDPREFAQGLLRWARTSEPQLASTPPQRNLLEILAEHSRLSSLVSLTGVAEFLATWEEFRADNELDAPRRALPRLGVLPDRNLLRASGDIADRLLKNFTLTREIARMAGSRLQQIRRRVSLRSPEERRKGLVALECAEKIRRIGNFAAYSCLDYEEARAVFKPTPKTTPGPVRPRRPEIRDGHAVATDGGELLIDGKNDALERLVESVQSALTDAVDGEEDSVSGHYMHEGEEQQFKFEVERDILTWVRYFCSADAWGGFFAAGTPSLEDALREYSQCEPALFEPLKMSIAHDGQQYDLRTLIDLMQRELTDAGETTVDLCGLWDSIVATRMAVLNHLDILIHQPMLALAGQSTLRRSVVELLEAWDALYAELERHHPAMHEIDHAWTQLLFEAILSLDIVQIQTKLGSGKTSWKAILLPTHPLHLWRYERIATLARGLNLEGMDRSAVLEQLQKPEHYLRVIYLTSFPKGKGGNQALPVARDHCGLAVFENLRNAYSGSDGVDALKYCVRQFNQIYVNHTRPLRLALINPPNASHTLVTLLKRGRGRPISRKTLLIEIYATPDHEARLLGARRFSTKDRDQIEEQIANGRLRLRIHDKLLRLDQRLQALRDKPVHIVAVFDEATTAMRHQPCGTILLPMSPFAIRRRIAFQGINRKVELLPTAEESVFRSFYDVVARLQGAGSSRTPQASADADSVADQIDAALTDSRPAAFWFFFADRALPTPSRVSAARILERYEGQRRTVCYDASYERLALLLRAPLDKFNLRFSATQLEDLLEEGVALLGDGLLNLYKANAQPDHLRVQGFAGMLIAARDYRDRHPGALVVSVDTELARRWLRLTDNAERCDLLGLRNEDGMLTVDAIEVKTSGTGTGVQETEIQKANSQLKSTLQAIRSGLEEGDQSSVLAAPRQEMLKEVFVSGCQALTASREDRTRWVQWLKVLFRQADGAEEIRLHGTVYAVELSNNGPATEQPLTNDPCEVVLRRLREERIQDLVSDVSPQSKPPERPDGDVRTSPSRPTTPPMSPPTPEGTGDRPVRPSADSPESGLPKERRDLHQEHEEADLGIRFQVGHSLVASDRKPYYLHPSNTKLNQLNIGVVGDLGTGKTQLTKALIYHFRRRAADNRGHPPKFLIFDYKHDYTKPDFVDAVGARVVSPHRIPLNVFRLPDAQGQLPPARLARFKFLSDVLQKIYGGIGPKQRNHIKRAVMQAYKCHAPDPPTLTDVFQEYSEIVGDKVDAPYSILSDLVDLEVFVDRAADAKRFDEFFSGVTVIDLAIFGIGDKERNMLVVLFLNLYYEYMLNLVKQPYRGSDPQLRFIDSILLVDEADNIMKYNFDVLRQILLQGREFGVGVLLASQFLSHFKTRETDYSQPLLTWFIHKVPNVTPRELESIGLNRVVSSTVEKVKSLDLHQCLYKTLDVPGRFVRAVPFYEIVDDSSP